VWQRGHNIGKREGKIKEVGNQLVSRNKFLWGMVNGRDGSILEGRGKKPSLSASRKEGRRKNQSILKMVGAPTKMINEPRGQANKVTPLQRGEKAQEEERGTGPKDFNALEFILKITKSVTGNITFPHS